MKLDYSVVCSVVCAATLLTLNQSAAAAPRIVVDLPAKVVLGFPIPIQLEVFGPRTNLAFPNLAQDVNPYELSLTSDAKSISFIVERSIIVNAPTITRFGRSETSYAPAVFLDVAEGDHILLEEDLSRLRGWQNRNPVKLAGLEDTNVAPSGSYTLRVYSEREEVLYLNQRIELVAPSKSEKGFLKALMARHREFEKDRKLHPSYNSPWETFVTDDGLFQRAETDLTPLAKDQLSYWIALGKAIRGEDFSGLVADSAKPTSMSRFWRGAFLFLDYDRALYGGDQTEADALKAELLQRYPPLKNFVYEGKLSSASGIEFFRKIWQERGGLTKPSAEKK